MTYAYEVLIYTGTWNICWFCSFYLVCDMIIYSASIANKRVLCFFYKLQISKIRIKVRSKFVVPTVARTGIIIILHVVREITDVKTYKFKIKSAITKRSIGQVPVQPVECGLYCVWNSNRPLTLCILLIN